MSENNQILARRVVEKKKLSSEQADQLLAECDRTGRSFRELALGRGLVSAQDFQIAPPKQLRTGQAFAIFGGLMVFMIFVLLATNYFQKRSHARDVLVKTRMAMLAAPGSPRVWKESLEGFDTYIKVFPEDAAVITERERSHQYLQDYTIAIADMELQAKLNPARAEFMKSQIAKLRELKARSAK